MLQFATGYTIGYLVYQVGTLITTGALGAGFFPGLIAVVAIVAIVVLLIINTERKMKKEYALKKAA